jgi:hypothetical protein
MNKRFVLLSDNIRHRAALWLESIPLHFERPLEMVVRDYEADRNTDQNAALWAALEDISEQVVWHGQKYSPADWKEIITAGLKTQRFAPGIEGGIVALGISTSRMKKAEFSELLEYVHWFGAEQGVKFGAKELA